MVRRPTRPLERGLLVFAFVFLGVSSVWVYRNRETLAAACLNTVDGVASKVAHLNEPFGVGATVEPKNPVIGIVPEFTLTERSGRTVTKDDLLGSYWIASFIFTRCATSCPLIVAELGRLQSDLPEEILLVSFSVDPEHDTPEVLEAYAVDAGAAPERWLFLTGDRDMIYRQIREGFLLAVEENRNPDPGWEITHSPRLALIDPKGRIRGYFESNNPEDMKRLRSDVTRLLARHLTAAGAPNP